VVSGNYNSLMKDTIWQDANTIIWLNYPFGLVIHRFLIRTYRRVFLKEKCCGNNYESLGRVFSNESMFIWILKTYSMRKRRMNAWRKGIFSSKKWIELTRPKQAKALIKKYSI